VPVLPGAGGCLDLLPGSCLAACCRWLPAAGGCLLPVVACCRWLPAAGGCLLVACCRWLPAARLVPGRVCVCVPGRSVFVCPGPGSQTPGPRCLVPGPWWPYLVPGPWSLVAVPGPCCLLPGPCRWPWCLAPGPWTWWPWSLDLAPRPMIRGPWRHSECPHPRAPKTGPGPGGAGFSPFLHGMFHVKHFLTPCSNKGPPLSNKSTCVKICAIPKRNGP
jgi:hypothetical protein